MIRAFWRCLRTVERPTINMTQPAKRKYPADSLQAGEFIGRAKKRQGEPENPECQGDWLAFPESTPAAPAASTPPASATDPAFQPLGLNADAWGKAKSKALRIPSPGRHLVAVRSAFLRAPAGGGPEVLNCILQVIDGGPDAGTTVLACFSIKSANERARNIAIYKLSQLCECAGFKGMPNKIGDLVGLVCGVLVEHKPHWNDPQKTQAYPARFYKADDV
jgi:hypothetical protein